MSGCRHPPRQTSDVDTCTCARVRTGGGRGPGWQGRHLHEAWRPLALVALEHLLQRQPRPVHQHLHVGIKSRVRVRVGSRVRPRQPDAISAESIEPVGSFKGDQANVLQSFLGGEVRGSGVDLEGRLEGGPVAADGELEGERGDGRVVTHVVHPRHLRRDHMRQDAPR